MGIFSSKYRKGIGKREENVQFFEGLTLKKKICQVVCRKYGGERNNLNNIRKKLLDKFRMWNILDDSGFYDKLIVGKKQEDVCFR